MSEVVADLYLNLGGASLDGGGRLPAIHSRAMRTERGTPYLQVPGVAMLARPAVSTANLAPFLDGFDQELSFDEYLNDPTSLPAAAQLCKVAGQLCYMSFGPGRTKNERADRYFDNLKSSGHGSVLEHATFSFLFYGVSRSLTHELVRHRAGFGFSQVSQRYVSGKVLRFVERPEYLADPELHRRFIERIDNAAEEYEYLSERLVDMQKEGTAILSGEMRTDLRKKGQQTARSVLPNETEAPIVVTANVRSWRHFIEMRASDHAETEIRELGLRVFLCLRMEEPILFDDYSVDLLPDGTRAVRTQYTKV